MDLFSLDSGYEVNVLSEDPTTGALTDLVMLKPAGTNENAEYVTRYVTEVTIVDENSLPQANFSLSVAADRAVGLWVGNVLYTVTPSNPAQLATDGSGILRFAFFAADIQTPTFSFTADGLQSPPTIHPAQEVNDYLSGSVSALPGRPAFDATGNTLSVAKMQVYPDWSPNPTTNFISPNVPTANIPATAKAITQLYTIPVSASGSSGQWSVAASSGSLGGSSFWHDLCNFPHDLEQAVKKAVVKITSIAVDLDKKLISFTMELANGLSQLMTLAIHTFEDIVSAVKSIFRFVERGIDEAIDWLKSLFAWSDVINTKRVYEAGLTGLLNRLGSNLDKTSPYYIGTLFTNFWTDDVIADVKAAYSRASQHFAAGQSFSAISSAVPFPSSAQPAGSDALHQDKVSNTQNNNGTQTNYVTAHVKTYGGNGGTFPPGSQAQGTASGVLNAYGQNKNAADVNSVGSTLQQLFSDPKAFADVVMYDVIQGLQTASLAVLDVIEDIVNALIAAISDAFTAFQNMLTKPLEIPVISWLYKQISGGDPLTVLDLACLMMAVPTTILYKLTYGLPDATAPFSAADVSAAQQQFGPGNFQWPPEAGGQSMSSTTVGTSVGSFSLGGAGAELLVFNAGVYAIFDLFNDLEAYSGFENPAPPGTPADPVCTFFSVTSLIATLVGQWLSAPFDIFGDTNTKARRMTAALWGLNFISFLTGVLFMIDSLKLAEYQYSGVGVSSFIGLLLFAYGIAVSVYQAEDPNKEYNALYWVQNALAPIPSALKPLVTVVQQYEQPAGAVAMGILGVADILLDGANGVLGFCEDVS